MMGYANHIGRVGALAVALGIGTAVATTPWVTAADPTESDSSSSTSASSTSESSESSEGSSATASDTDDGSAADEDEKAAEHKPSAGETAEPGAPVAEGGDSRDASPDDVPKAESRLQRNGSDSNSGSVKSADETGDSAPRSTVNATTVTQSSAPSAREPSPAVTANQVEPTAEAVAVAAAILEPAVTPSVKAAPEPSAPVQRAMTNVLSALSLGVLATDTPAPPTETPAMWALLAWTRRQVGQGEPENLAASPMLATALALEAETAQQDIAVGRDPGGVVVSGNTVYVANQYDKTITVIDATTNSAVGTISVASTPTALAVSPDGSRLYVTTKANNSVAIIDTVTRSVVTNVRVGSAPTGVAVTPDGQFLYVTNGGSTTVSVVDTVLKKEVARIVVGSAPDGVAVSPDGTRAYVTTRYNDSVSVINTASRTVVGKVTVGDSPREVAFTPDGATAYVTNIDGTVSVIDTASTTAVARITVGSQPMGLVASPDGEFIYVANSNDTVSLIDTSSRTVVSTVTVDPTSELGEHMVAVSADGTHLYVTDTKDRVLRVVSTVTVIPNEPPVAVDDIVGTIEGSPVTVAVLGNDTDLDDDELTPQLVTGPDHGTAAPTAGGQITYTPDENFYGTDTFTYNVSDGVATSNTATVTVTVTPRPTVGTPDPATGVVSGSVRLIDPDGDVVTYSLGTVPDPTRGRVTVNSSTGAWTFTPTVSARLLAAAIGAPKSDKQVSFTVVASDGTTESPVVVTAPVTPPDNAVIKALFPNSPAGELVANADGTRVYVLDRDASPQFPPGLVVVDTTVNPYGNSIARVDVGGVPQHVVLSPDGGYAYVSADFDHVSVVNTATYVVEVTIPITRADSLALSPDGSRLYVGQYSLSFGTGVAVVDTATRAVTGTYDLPHEYPVPPGELPQPGVAIIPSDLAVSPDGSRLYVLDRYEISDDLTTLIPDSGGLTVIDITTGAVVKSMVLAEDPVSVAVNPVDGRVYVVSQGSSVVTVIDPDTNDVTNIIPGGGVDPWAVSISPDGTRTYVVDSLGMMTVIDTSTNMVTGTAPLSFGYAYDVAFSGDGTHAFVSTNDSGEIKVVSVVPATPQPVSNTVTDTIDLALSGAAFSPDGKLMYATSPNLGTVSVIDTETKAVLHTVDLGRYAAGVDISPDGKTLYVTKLNPGTGPGSLLVIDTETYEIRATVTLDRDPEVVVVSPDGSRVYVADRAVGVYVIDAASNTIIKTIPIEINFGMVASPDGNYLYILDYGFDDDGHVTVINTALNYEVHQYFIGSSPAGLAISPDGERLYVTNAEEEGTVTVLDLDTQARTTISVGNTPLSVVVSPDGRFVYVANTNDSTVSVIDASTNKVVTTALVDTYARNLVVNADGTAVYVLTDSYAENVVAIIPIPQA
jgi:YVTN family beta-propeller protein